MRGERGTTRRRAVRATCSTALAAAVIAACSGSGSSDVIVLADSGASNPTVAVDPSSGTTYVAWVGTVEGSSDVWLARVAPDGSVPPAVRVNDIAGDAAPHLQAPAQVALGPDGSVYVAWTNATMVEGRRFPASDLRFARSLDGGRSFESALTVNDDRGGPPSSHTFHDLSVTPDGTVVVSWLDGRREAEGAAGGSATEHGSGHETHEPVPGPDVRISISTDRGASFGTSRTVDRQTCPCCRTALEIGPDGTLYLAWRKIFPGDIRDIVVARSTDLGATWDEPRRVADDDWVFPGCPHAGPSMTVDGAGTLHIAWYTGKPESPGVYYARSTDGAATFSSAKPLLTGAWVPPSQVQLAARADGFVQAVWEDRREEGPVLRSRLAASDGAPEAVEPGSNPALAAAGGYTALAWLDGDRVLVRMSGPAG